MRTFYEIFTTLCAEKQIAPSRLLTDFGLSRSRVTSWKNGKIPKQETLQRLADYFGVTVDYLLGRTPARREATSSPREAISREDVWFALAGEVDVELDEDDFADIASYAQYRIEQKRKKKQESE